MAFLTQLAPDSAPRMEALLRTHLLPGVTSLKVGASFGADAQPGPHLMRVRQMRHSEQMMLGSSKILACDFGMAEGAM